MICSLHIKLARTALGLTQDQLAQKSFVSPQTIKKIETTNPNDLLKSNKSTIIALVKFFEDEGVEFLKENGEIGVKIGQNIIKEKF
ncbi:helix-turn-helix domain-containing protein [Rickettsiales bacterium]|nr:helix-turn-helix domain-containing protein [Rickettsiales bacterium]